ncbi:hypothetical protein AEAC466_04630 [Asticcacaulis sp. AC466]|nr:hypothetical protein AEAC466_04630 [Asticcacaulis sp. AC466]
MNALEIEEVIPALAEQPFDADEFPFAFIKALDAKEMILRRANRGAA